jgi:DNA/RNA-binding domain of Phe-tRNA-synthetase-like protein
MKIKFNSEIKKKFSDLIIRPVRISGVKVVKNKETLEEFKDALINGIKEDYTPETLKDAPIIRMYRDFYWRIGIDPTKIRPSSEALIRRVIKGRTLPKINTLVDAYNLASMKTNMALAAFDSNKISGELTMRFARSNEQFQGIGMEKTIDLKGNEPIITDEEKIIAVYPYRDSEATKVTLDTTETLILVCGVPGIIKQVIEKTGVVAIEYITRFNGGLVEDP